MSKTTVAMRIKTVADDAQTPLPVKAWLESLLVDLEEPDVDPQHLPGGETPNSIGAQADLYAEVREKRLAMEKAAGQVKEREVQLYKLILNTLNESPDTGASGQHHRVQRVMKDVRNVEDWSLVHKFIQETGNFEMLQKRLSDGAVKEWAETHDGALPPGIKADQIPTLSFSKI